MVQYTKMTADILKSHIKANVSPESEFNTYLVRDLIHYFNTDTATKDITINYELLRDNPTQSGAAFPRFYLWVKVYSNNQLIKQGAIRIAAIEKKQLKVYDFLSKYDIQKTSR